MKDSIIAKIFPFPIKRLTSKNGVSHFKLTTPPKLSNILTSKNDCLNDRDERNSAHQVSSELSEERIDWHETIGWSFGDNPEVNA